MGKRKKKSFYGVWKAGGRIVNAVFQDWNEVRGMRCNVYKGFGTRAEAEAYLLEQAGGPAGVAAAAAAVASEAAVRAAVRHGQGVGGRWV